MHWYKHHIGDYLSHTAHLSLLEHGVYLRILHHCYLSEKPVDPAEISRAIGARGSDEREAVEYVLKQFFILVDGLYIQKRVEKELTSYRIRGEINKANGMHGGRPKKPNGLGNETESVISENRMGSKTKPTENPNQEPRTENQEKHIRFAPLRYLVSLGVDESIARDWLTVRKLKKSANTELAFDAVKREADKAGISINDAVRLSVENSWSGFKASWLSSIAEKDKPSGLFPNAL